jgi:hypothetical protein
MSGKSINPAGIQLPILLLKMAYLSGLEDLKNINRNSQEKALH